MTKRTALMAVAVAAAIAAPVAARTDELHSRADFYCADGTRAACGSTNPQNGVPDLYDARTSRLGQFRQHNYPNAMRPDGRHASEGARVDPTGKEDNGTQWCRGAR